MPCLKILFTLHSLLFTCMSFPYHVVDLTHTLDENIPSWTGKCGFHQEIKLDYDEQSSCRPLSKLAADDAVPGASSAQRLSVQKVLEDAHDATTQCASAVELRKRPVSFRVQQLKMHAGIGTHLDAPAHCSLGKATINELDLNNLVAPCVVIDVSARADEHYSVSQTDITAFEAIHGIIEPNSFVIIRTGWDRFWKEPKKYHNNFLFPSISKEAATLLLQRNIVGLGIDTLSPDRPESGYPVHGVILDAEKYIIENVAHSDRLPQKGSWIIALPIKTRNGTEAPLRLIALLPK